ncbi:hypothetical protein KC357_g286 [Hortaea werneckii]|nr:hypothetical protein KC357_g286 [Hortaea werneckii]
MTWRSITSSSSPPLASQSNSRSYRPFPSLGLLTSSPAFNLRNKPLRTLFRSALYGLHRNKMANAFKGDVAVGVERFDCSPKRFGSIEWCIGARGWIHIGMSLEIRKVKTSWCLVVASVTSLSVSGAGDTVAAPGSAEMVGGVADAAVASSTRGGPSRTVIPRTPLGDPTMKLGLLAPILVEVKSKDTYGHCRVSLRLERQKSLDALKKAIGVPTDDGDGRFCLDLSARRILFHCELQYIFLVPGSCMWILSNVAPSIQICPKSKSLRTMSDLQRRVVSSMMIRMQPRLSFALARHAGNKAYESSYIPMHKQKELLEQFELILKSYKSLVYRRLYSTLHFSADPEIAEVWGYTSIYKSEKREMAPLPHLPQKENSKTVSLAPMILPDQKERSKAASKARSKRSSIKQLLRLIQPSPQIPTRALSLLPLVLQTPTDPSQALDQPKEHRLVLQPQRLPIRVQKRIDSHRGGIM